MIMQEHIFNIKRIVDKIKENRAKAKQPEEPNLYEKVNLIFKGAVMGSPELVDEIQLVIKEQASEATSFLKERRKEIKGR